MRKLKNEELGRLSVTDFKKGTKAPLHVVLDNVRSMNNVGSAFRTADAFSIEKMHLCGITGRPPHREINKTALGATDSVDWEYYKEPAEVIRHLQDKGCTIISVEQTDRSVLLNDFTPRSDTPYGIVFGNEVFGVSNEVIDLTDIAIEIPQFGTKHSLNISVSIGIVLWHFYQHLDYYHPE